MSEHDPFAWMDDPRLFWEGLLSIAATGLAIFGAGAAIALFLAHFPG